VVDIHRLPEELPDLAVFLMPVFYSCFLAGGVSSVSEGFLGGFRAWAVEM
jgi:hypothetical protein